MMEQIHFKTPKMKTKITKNQSAMVVLAMFAVIFSGLFFISHSSQKSKLKREKIRTEALLSEKLELEKNREISQKEMAALKSKHATLVNKMKETSALLSTRENEIKKLAAESATARELKKKNAELEVLRQQMEADIDSLVMNMDRLMQEQLQAQEQLETMKTSNDFLSLKNAMLEAMLSDNFRAEALKGKNEKLTVVARRANTLVSSFDVPAGFGEAIHFKVITPEENEISSLESKFASVKVQEYEGNLMASLSGGADERTTFSKRAELVYKPEQKLSRGIYRFQVYDGDSYMGSVQLKLK
jgi:lipopolysaccharide biosynthesis protein